MKDMHASVHLQANPAQPFAWITEELYLGGERAQGGLINEYNHLMGGTKDDKARLYKTPLDMALSNLLVVTLLWAGGWTRQPPEVPTNLYPSVVRGLPEPMPSSEQV